MPPVLPDSLARLLSLLRPVFTAPSFDVFSWLVHGFIGRIGERTITGVWQAARLGGVYHHSRAHEFFARRRWSADELGLRLAAFCVERFIDAEAPIPIAVDDTLFRRCGPRVHAAAWHFDSATPTQGRSRLGFGNSFVCLGVLLRLAGTERTICLPLIFRLWRPAAEGEEQLTRVDLAHQLVGLMAKRFSERRIELAADSYYANNKLALLPENVGACVRLRSNAAFWAPPPKQRGPRRGRPRKRGERLGSVRELAGSPDSRWRRVEVGERSLEVLVFDCLWYRVLGERRVRVVIAREPGRTELPVLAVLSTDTEAGAAEILGRYRDRWAIEVAFAEAKGGLGVGEARNRVERAVERTVPFGFLCRAIVIVWYALNGDPAADVESRRLAAPWYRQKRVPSFADMLVALRRELIRAEFLHGYPSGRSRQEIGGLGLVAEAAGV